MMMMTMTDYLVTLAWTECWTGRLQCSERSGRKKPQWCSNLGQWWQYRRREVDHILMGGGLSFLTFAICWFDRQGTSSQYQYCYWSTIVIWILSSDIVSSTNSIQIVRRQWCRWFDSADVITMNMSIRVQLPGHDSSKNGQLAMFRSPHLRVVCHPGANSVIMMLIGVKTTPPHSSFKNYFVIPGKFQNYEWCLCIK